MPPRPNRTFMATTSVATTSVATTSVGLSNWSIPIKYVVVAGAVVVAAAAALICLSTVSWLPSPSWKSLQDGIDSLQRLRKNITKCVQCPIDDFFNRKQEVDILSSRLLGRPMFIHCTGPPNSGKTTLLRHVLEDLQEGGNRVEVFHLNLREIVTTTEQQFQESILQRLTTWTENIMSKVRLAGICINARVAGAEASAEVKLHQEPDSPNMLFEKLSARLPKYSLLQGKLPTPVLFIDECPKLNHLVGSKFLKDFFDFMITSTKTEKKFHVILASTDSFYHFWLQKIVPPSVLRTLTVGDLAEQEASRFWQESIKALLPEEIQNIKYEDVRDVVGGNMLLMQSYLEEYRERKGKMLPEDFSQVVRAKSKVLDALRGAVATSFPDYSPNWSREDMLQVMEHLTSSKGGFLKYEDLVDQFGDKKIDSMIAHGVLHLRPSTVGSFDLPGAPNARIVTAESPSELYAMKSILKDPALKR